MTRNTRGVSGSEICEDIVAAGRREWLETDGLGGYASGTIAGIRTRRYHGLLLVATRPPTERRLLVNGLEEHIVAPNSSSRSDAIAEHIGISAQRYAPDATHPRGFAHLAEFHLYPWPTWIYSFKLATGEAVTLEREIFIPRGRPIVVVTWRLRSGPEQLALEVRPLLSGRDIHQAHHHNATLNPTCRSEKSRISWAPYQGIPRVFAYHSGAYQHGPQWYDQFLYDAELERGLDAVEDLWAPGLITFPLRVNSPHHLVFSTQKLESVNVGVWKRTEKARRTRLCAVPQSMADELELAADKYIVSRGKGRTICAGYPWFTDWGRDTFISMRGLCLATHRLTDARSILLEWAKTVNRGMLPNRFPDEGDQPEFNSVDASLWFVIVAREYLDLAGDAGGKDRGLLLKAIREIMVGYCEGTRFGIHMDADGLLSAGETGTQLTWMDAKFEDTCFSPRQGKPVEIQALWINALAALETLSSAHRAVKATKPGAKNKKVIHAPDASNVAATHWAALKRKAIVSFRARFWNADGHYLFDVCDGPQGDDASLRPNQLLAVSLPEPILDAKKARAVVDAVERSLVTPLGIRTLAAGQHYIGRYTGGRRERDAAYHNGTVWPWLFGPFIEAWVKTRSHTAKAQAAARRDAMKFLQPLEQHLSDAGLGHISEIADGDSPHEPKGCPWQAWSVAEPLRLLKTVLAPSASPRQTRR